MTRSAIGSAGSTLGVSRAELGNGLSARAAGEAAISAGASRGGGAPGFDDMAAIIALLRSDTRRPSEILRLKCDLRALPQAGASLGDQFVVSVGRDIDIDRAS